MPLVSQSLKQLEHRCDSIAQEILQVRDRLAMQQDLPRSALENAAREVHGAKSLIELAREQLAMPVSETTEKQLPTEGLWRMCPDRKATTRFVAVYKTPAPTFGQPPDTTWVLEVPHAWRRTPWVTLERFVEKHPDATWEMLDEALEKATREAVELIGHSEEITRMEAQLGMVQTFATRFGLR